MPEATIAALPSLDEIRQAQQIIYSVMPPTPQFTWPLLGRRMGTEVWVKHENHTPIGAFKARTAIVYAAELFDNGRKINGLITATRGNHGQSVALAAQRFGVPCTIVVPFGNSKAKNAAMQAQGATLIEHMVPSYHYNIVKGVATYWLEFFTAVSNLDVVYVPIGQGSGICSCVAVRNGMQLNTKIIGVVSEGAPAYALSFAAGRMIEAPVTTQIADGMSCRVPVEDSLQVIFGNVDRMVVVSDDEVCKAMKIYFTDTHNVVEGAGAAPLAAALKERSSLAGKRVGLVATGGNVDHDVFAQILLE
jgi:threonine dehydratase